MLDRLLAEPGVDERCALRSRFGFLALHGGLERGTDAVAAAAAERAGASLYAVVQPDDLYWHVPSHRYDPTHSETLAAFLDHVDVVVSLHGYGREGCWTTLLAGGANRPLAGLVAGTVRAALPGYRVLDDLAEIPPALRGLHAANPVNRARHGGVQLELPPRVRGLGPFWDEWRADPCRPSLTPHTEALVGALAAAAGQWGGGRAVGGGEPGGA